MDWSKTALGIELGSTCIKAVLLDDSYRILAVGEHTWENKLENGLWTYDMADALSGVRACYAALKQSLVTRYRAVPDTFGAIGVSAMMHGYLVFDRDGKQLVPFRTWRNNNAAPAAERLTSLFSYRIPARWSVAHLYQAVLNGEPHTASVAFMTTLEGYIHYMLTGEKRIGVGEASGMFPIDVKTGRYHGQMAAAFDALPENQRLSRRLLDMLPEIAAAGECAGRLTAEGALLLDPDGDLRAGVPFCPPEGDAGTGMVATNSVKPGYGNISAGTSIFSMTVLERGLSRVHPELDLVATPDGNLVAMAHCSNCTSELNAWIGVFDDVLRLFGKQVPKDELYGALFRSALTGADDCDGLLAYNYLSGENLVKVAKGRPLFVRTSESRLNLPNFMRAQLYACIMTLKLGMDILKEENVTLKTLYAHGGIFKTAGVMQGLLASALGTPVTVTQSAGSGGPYGMALLAMYMLSRAEGEGLSDFLDRKVFRDVGRVTEFPDEKLAAGIARYAARFSGGLAVVREAVRSVK
ncbi:MAG: ATPase [Clostridiales bacterium]|jgi:sugar (pentulose or hexulose) kinase|nr:ATPase [Clostridiales bacterium]